MNSRSMKAGFLAAVVVWVTACGGGGGSEDSGSNSSTPFPPSQTFSFDNPGPITLPMGSSMTNKVNVSAVSFPLVEYFSSNPYAVTVTSGSGIATAVGAGTADITAVVYSAGGKGAIGSGTYSIYSQTPDKVSAYIGDTDTQVSLPASANGGQFLRARVADCAGAVSITSCIGAILSFADGSIITDTRATLTTPAYYSIVNGSSVGAPIDVRVDRFSNRIGHAVLRFNNRYWVIGGGEPILPGAGAVIQHTAKSDVWSSADGKTWKLETSDGGFGGRWFHQAVVFNNRMWIISGSPIPLPASSASQWWSDIWSSADGITWTQDTSDAQLPWWSVDLNVIVFNNEMLAVSGGRIYSYSTSSHQFVRKTATVTDLTGTQLGRTQASLTLYDNKLWYIGGKLDFPNTQPVGGDAMNDVWQSADGIAWTQVNANAPFAARYRHSTFVANGRLWVLGGQGAVAGVATTVTGDAWSTTDGITWTQENANGLARGYLMPVVQETDKATLFGGLQFVYANNVWQTTDGIVWSELSANAQFSSRVTKAVEFNQQMWIVGGMASDGSAGGLDTNDIWRSSDGINWTRVATTGSIFSPRSGHGLVVYNSRMWVIGGANNPSGGANTQVRLNDVWSSADGISWRLETANAGFAPRVGHGTHGVQKLWVIAGNAAAGDLNDVWSSTDGITWGQLTANAGFTPRTSPAVEWLGGYLWLIGGGSSATYNDIWRSTDGVTWTSVAPIGPVFSPRTRHALVVLFNPSSRMYLVGGAANDNYATGVAYNDVWSTVDGVTWRLETSNAGFSPRSLHAAVARKSSGELWLVGGLGKGLLNDVWRSTDGVNWRVGFSHDIAAP